MADINSKLSNERAEIDPSPLLIDGKWVAGEGRSFELLNKYTLQPIEQIPAASPDQISRAVESADAAFRKGGPSPYEKGLILERAAAIVEDRRSDFVRAMQEEAGFTASDAGGEVSRCIQTLKLSGEEARRLAGDVIPLAGAPNQAGRIGFTIRVPLGVVAAITPFNSPLNTVTHKVAPAFAAGNAVVLKPSSNTPITAVKLGKALMEAGMPAGFLSILHGGGEVATAILKNEKVRFFAFTGSTEVGLKIQQGAGLRRTQMELGSISFNILCDDANLERALPKIINAGYRKAGQVCTSVQILLVHKGIREKVQSLLTGMVQDLPFGNPFAPETVVGPMIAEKEAVRVESWIEKAIRSGAERLAGGVRDGAVLSPTLLTNINESMEVAACEIFGPVVCIVPFSTLDEAIGRVNSTPFGLASGIFTNRLQDALSAAQRLEVGGVHVNETSSSRVDMMPYGGSKDSGFGREGPRYAIHEMTEERIITISTQ